MALRRLWGLEVWLLVVMTAFLMFSATARLVHPPHWGLWLAAGLLAVFMVARPKTIGLVLLSALVIWGLLVYRFELFGYGPFEFAVQLTEETYLWLRNPYRADLLLVGTVTSLAVFAIVYIQFLMVARGKNIAPLIILGLAVYTLLWHYRFPEAERGLFIFFTLAFPAASFLYIRNRSRLDKHWYKAGILALAAMSALLVSVLPSDLEPLEVPKRFRVFTDPYAAEQHGSVDGENGAGIRTGDRRTGYSPGGELGGGLTDSSQPVLKIELVEGVLPTSLYLRGQARDYYTGSSWEKRNAEPADNLESAFKEVQVYKDELKVLVTYLLPENDLFGLFPTTALELLEADVDVSGDEGYSVDNFGNLQAISPDFQGRYELSGKMITAVDLESFAAGPEMEIGPEQLLPFLQVPGDLPGRVEALALEITAGAGNEAEKAHQIMAYLKQFPYTRDTPDLPPEDDFVDHFLFDLQTGYCTYYASAMVILLRLNGVPARYVTGYRAGLFPEEEYIQFHPQDPLIRQAPGSMEVRRNNAHAWVEAFLAGYGWVAFEPTSPYRISPPGGGIGMEDAFVEEEASAAEGLDEEVAGRLGFLPAGILLLAVIILGAAGIFSYSYLILSRTGSPAALYAGVVQVKGAFNLPPDPGDTPGQVTEQLKKDMPELAEAFEAMKERYHEVCYAQRKGIGETYNRDLAGLPFKTALLYRKKVSPVKYTLGWFRLLAIMTRPGRLQQGQERKYKWRAVSGCL